MTQNTRILHRNISISASLTMSLSLSHGRTLDPGCVGLEMQYPPPADTSPTSLQALFDTNPLSEQLPTTSPPLELEIGSGKGTFLVQEASLHPQINYIGLEWARAFWLYAADRCRRRNLPNVRVVRAEAAAWVRSYATDQSFHQIHIYYPDPWPKKRHHKRRLIQAPFLRELHRVLTPHTPSSPTPSGLVRIVTDHTDYFHWILEHAGLVTDLFEQLPFTSPGSAQPGETVGTNFERKYRSENRPAHALILRKKS